MSCEFWRGFRIVPVLMFLNELIWIIDLSSALVGMLMSSSKLFLFLNEVHLNSGARLLLEMQYCVIVIKHVAFFTICAKLTTAFTFTILPLNFYTSVSGCGCGFGFEQNFWRIDGFGEKRRGSADLHTPIQPPSLRSLCQAAECLAFSRIY